MQAGPTARTRVRGARKYIVTAEVVAFGEQRREQKEARVNGRAALAHVWYVQPALVAGGLFRCFAEFLMQPVAGMCLFPYERGDDEPCFVYVTLEGLE